MGAKSKLLSLLVLILLVNVWYFFFYVKSHPTTLDVVPVSDSGSLNLYVEPDAGKQFLVEAINSAKKEILVEVYLLSDKDVISALENAEARGVGVNVMLEEHPFGGGKINPATKDELAAKGVKVQWTNPKYALTHEKGMVIDGSTAFILSQNLTTSSFTKNREYDIVDTNPVDVNEVRNIFLADWKREGFTPNTSSHLLVSPNTSRPALTSLISSAKKEIDIEVEDIEDPQIISLMSGMGANIPVRLILPTFTQLAANKDAVMKLTNVEVKTISSPYMHAKLILVDNSKAYIGSINLSSQSMDENRELGIILSEPNAIDTLRNTFSIDWDKAQPVNLAK